MACTASPHARRFVQRTLVVVASVFLLLLWAKPSHAYPWMIQHQYTGCALCHLESIGRLFAHDLWIAPRLRPLLKHIWKRQRGGEVEQPEASFRLWSNAPDGLG